MKPSIGRRTFMQGVAVGALSLPAMAAAGRVQAQDAAGSQGGYTYEIVKTEAEWHAQLGDEAFGIMRQRKTERMRSSPLWNEVRDGDYFCKACDLHVYEAKWKVVIDLGWVFFTQNVPDSVLMGIDETNPYGAAGEDGATIALIEAHCRRCGSHFGHLITVKDGEVLHCLNGASLNFVERVA